MSWAGDIDRAGARTRAIAWTLTADGNVPLSVADVQAIVANAIGGENVGEVVSGRERFPINMRYPREIRDSLKK